MKNRTLILTILGASFVWAAQAQTAADNTSVESVASKARALDGRGRPDLAAQTWRQVLLIDPNHQEALAALARASKQAGNATESNGYLARLRKLNPNHPALQQIQSMRVLSQQQARLREAERLAGLQQFDRALQVYREVYGDDPPEGGQAIAYYETQAAVPGGWEPATAALKALSDKYPNSEDYRLSLGKLLTYRPATRLNGLRLLESVKNNNDLASKARVAWRQALVWEESNPQVAASLRSYISRYPDQDLQKILASLSRSAPAPAQQTGLARTNMENVGYTALAANNLPLAETEFKKQLDEDAESSGALAGMGFVRMKQENFDEAIEYFERAQKIAPQEALVGESLQSARFFQFMKEGTAAFNADQLEQAAGRYRKALELRPTSIEAMQGLAGASAKGGDWAEAMRAYENLSRMQPDNQSSWVGLLTARYRVAGADSFLASLPQVPDTMRATLARSNVEYLTMLAVANSDKGKNTEARQNLEQAIQLVNARALPLTTDQELQFAGLFLRLGAAVESASILERLTQKEPNNAGAWEGLAAALVQLHQEPQAYRLLARIPEGLSQSMMSRPGFLRSLAAIQVNLGQLEAARESLRRSLELDTASTATENIAAQLQLAHLMLRQGDAAQAEGVLRKMVASYPENADVWKALVAALHQEGRDDAALVESRRVPPAPSVALDDDADYVSLMASVQDALAHYEDALRLARRASDIMIRTRREVPADLNIQMAWLVLKAEADERELLAILQSMSARTDLTPVQTEGVNAIWSSWSLKRANAAAASGDYTRGAAILETATKILPKDAAIRSTLAGLYLKAGDSKKALASYKAWGLTDAKATDFAGAIGAAIAAGDKSSANTWNRKALSLWPGDATLLKLAGQLAAESGDYRKAEEFWRAALVAVPEPSAQSRSAQEAAIQSSVPVAADPRKAMGDLLLGGEAPRTTAPSSSPQILPSLPSAPAKSSAPQILPLPSESARPTPVPAKPSAETPTVQGPASTSKPAPLARSDREPRFLRVAQIEGPVVPRTVPSQSPVTPATAAGQETGELRDELQDRINAIEARNTPYFGFGGMVRARSGEPGFERFLIQEATMEASAVLRNSMRVSIIGRPTYLDNGASDGLSQKRFGLAPVGTVFDAQAVGGIGGEVQLSSQTFGLRVGGTPQNFLVPNVIGGLRFRPGNGPITIIAERESIRDSLLAFAGVRDPITNRVWGGVVGTGAAVQGNFGGAKSGFYGGFGYQVITGKDVQRNTRLDGNLGAYWSVFNNNAGALTAGFNIFAMRYEKNLRFYTLGHGGYFSPQRYLLFNVPLEWRGVYQRKVQYLVKGGLGSQHFQEEASPFFPTQPSLQGRTGPVYPKRVSTGANYNMDAQAAYQITPQWHMGAYANLNNSRNFTSQAVGIYIRFSTKPRSINQDLGLQSVPDWRGVEPFGLP